MQEAAERDPRLAAWAEPTPGLYTYDAETNKVTRLTDLDTKTRDLLNLG